MPNTEPAIHDAQTLLLAEEKAKKAHCDYALYLGATPYNAQDIVPLSAQAAALKMYLNPTFRKGNLFTFICLQFLFAFICLHLFVYIWLFTFV